MLEDITRSSTRLSTLILLWLLSGFSAAMAAESSLSDNLRIDSKHLNYALQYRVYLPDSIENLQNVPVIYVTDGQEYLDRGGMQQVLDKEIESGTIQPVAAVFVDSRNPDKLRKNRRNSEFMCNKLYALFFANELMPAVEKSYPISHQPADRVILGGSFGGLNAACFGLMLPQIFPNIAMQSPASNEHVSVLSEQYSTSDKLPLKIFFSTGTRKDNIISSRTFHEVLEQKGYDMTYIEVAQGHNWNNWKPLLDDVLLTFFSSGPP